MVINISKVSKLNISQFRYKYHLISIITTSAISAMTSKMKVIFQLNTNTGSRIKQIAIHPAKNWVGIINDNNTFSLWNYDEKILIKSFSCNTLCDHKFVQIKQIVFFDKHTLCSIEQARNMKNNIIFVTNTKLIFYDYITDAIRQTQQRDLDQKIIRKICIYSEYKICIAMSDGTFKILDTKQSVNKGSMQIRTVKGYHVKPISWIFAYSQNHNQMPRVVTASDQDGLMACWNIEMILKSPANIQMATPCFKFHSSSKKSQIGSSEQITFLQYDPSSYRLITVNDQYIRLWSTMTGMQVKRIKNIYKYRQVVFFNHFSFVNQCFVAHSKTSKVMMIRNSGGDISINSQIQLRNFFQGPYSQNPHQQPQIIFMYTLPQHSSKLFLVTNFNMSILQIDKFHVCPFGFHQSFFTRMSTINSRQLIVKAQGQVRKNLTYKQITQLKFEDDILTNSFFLSVDQESLYFNLIQIQYSTMLHQTRKYKLHNLSQSSPLRQVQGGRSSILINFQGNQFIIFNKILSYYEIYAAYNEHESQDLLNNNVQVPNRIDFYSKFNLIESGYCRDIVYHQYKYQYAIIAGYDSKDNLIEYKINKEKKGLFKTKSGEVKISLSGDPVKFRILIYQKVGNNYKVIQKSEYFSSKTYKISSFGSFYGYSVMKQKTNFESLQFISSQKGLVREVQGSLNNPEQVYISYCQSYYILSYDKHFIVLKVQQNGSMCYFRTFEYTILHGYFWQKFFFFVTQNSLYFLQILNQQGIIIKIADNSNLSLIEKVIDDIEDDDFQPQLQILSPGQYQIINLVNMSLVLLKQSGNVTLIPLNGFPYIVFCLEIASGALEQSRYLYKNASKNIAGVMKQTLTNYGMIAPDLLD